MKYFTGLSEFSWEASFWVTAEIENAEQAAFTAEIVFLYQKTDLASRQ